MNLEILSEFHGFTLLTEVVMPPQVTMAPPDNSPVAERAKVLLRAASGSLQRVHCEFRDGILTLSGQLPTYYLKQVAQESVARLEGVRRIHNLIEVVPNHPFER